ncbi:Bromodomain-containing protein 7 [Pseudolycoriella hygida]|uniref:Bromodomain-containing protein 7 n=1 Tax=Pseudolycoriella hygida TaxID=35572 RepID=A0A9Q0SA86_9DIPT|nr:Bromodomain-containing protein 7 [Pseudolycoriella hygida]
MGSKKHKKHKSERRDKYEERQFSLERPPSLKLILKVAGSSSTPEHVEQSSDYGAPADSVDYGVEYFEKHKKSKKKKKKKDREKRHKHHKEKRRREDSSQEESVCDDNLQESILRYAGITTCHSLSNSPATKPIIPLKKLSPTPEPDPEVFPTAPEILIPEKSPNVHSQKFMETHSLKSPASDSSGREPRSCVLKLKQSKSPLSKLLDHLLRALEKKDPHQFFAWPVTDEIAPGYSSIISDPMDFLSIRQKVEENEYTTLQEFADDFRLMCENAIKYNHVDTVYHKAAKRLLHVGLKMLQPDQLMRSLRSLIMYMKELTPKELGFDLTQTEQHDDLHVGDSADEGMSTGAEEVNAAQLEEDEKKRNIREANNPQSRFEPFVDDLTAEEVLAQVQSASKQARDRVTTKNAAKMGFLRQNKDGTTSMKILVATENDLPERVISLGAFTGKLQQGTGQLQGFREDRRNTAKTIKPIDYGNYSSFAPTYDSRFANLCKEESELVLNTYADETGIEYAGSIMDFSQDSSYASSLANHLLDVLTGGEHRKTIGTLNENQRQRCEQQEIEQTFPHIPDDDVKKYENVQIDFNHLRSLSELGVDVSFLNNLEQNHKTIELHKKLQEQLLTNSNLIERLQQVQTERLSQPLPQHLAHVARPNVDEIQLAAEITANLTEMAKQLPPETIVAKQSLRKAMGLSDIGLEPARLNVPSMITNQLSMMHKDIDHTPVPMDLEPEGDVRSVPDLEKELRELLEHGSTLQPNDDGIEHMLLA